MSKIKKALRDHVSDRAVGNMEILVPFMEKLGWNYGHYSQYTIELPEGRFQLTNMFADILSSKEDTSPYQHEWAIRKVNGGIYGKPIYLGYYGNGNV